MTDIAELSLRVNAQTVESATKTLSNFKQVSESTEKSVIRNTNGMNAGFKNVSTGVKSVQTSAATAIPALKTLEVQTVKAANAGGGFAYKAKQMSMQLSQVASQGAVTGNYLQALAIQLPDLALGFGAVGVLVGAVAGSLGVYLVNAAKNASDGTENLSEKIKELTDDFRTATEAQKEIVRINLRKGLKEQEDGLKGVTERLDFYNKAIEANKTGLLSTETLAKSRVKRFEEEKKIVQAQADTYTAAIGKIKAEIEDLGGVEKERIGTIKDITANLQDEYDQLTMNNAQLLDRDLNQVKATDGEKKAAQAILEKVDALKAEKEAKDKLNQLASGITNVESQLDPNVSVINAAERRLAIINAANAEDLDNQSKYDALRVANAQKLSDDLVAIEKSTADQNSKILTAGQESALNSSGQLFGNLASIAQAGGEDQFQAYKNLASAQAAIAASLAVIKALAEGGPILGPILATSIGAVAAVQIAQIQGQEYTSSRASGGQAKGRVLVGENGPEVLNLGSQTGYVSPTTSIDKSNSGNTTVFSISAGVQGTVRSEILSLMPLIMQASVNAAAQSARNGGTMAKAVRLR